MEMDSFIDKRDGEIYRTVKIGDQLWFAENLRYKCEGALSYGGNLDEGSDPLVKCFGLLYHWGCAAAAVPEGWHLPSIDEWRELIAIVGGSLSQKTDIGDEVYTEAARHLKSRDLWLVDEEIPVPCSLDDFNFTAFPVGCMDEFAFAERGWCARFWCAEGQNKWAYRVHMDAYSNDVTLEKGWNDSSVACSIRCIKD